MCFLRCILRCILRFYCVALARIVGRGENGHLRSVYFNCHGRAWLNQNVEIKKKGGNKLAMTFWKDLHTLQRIDKRTSSHGLPARRKKQAMLQSWRLEELLFC